jgi:hypothetical protein
MTTRKPKLLGALIGGFIGGMVAFFIGTMAVGLLTGSNLSGLFGFAAIPFGLWLGAKIGAEEAGR